MSPTGRPNYINLTMRYIKNYQRKDSILNFKLPLKPNAMRRSMFWLIALLIFPAFTGLAQIKLPRLVSDGMILQRDTEVNLWGLASPNEPVSLNFQNKIRSEEHTSELQSRE